MRLNTYSIVHECFPAMPTVRWLTDERKLFLQHLASRGSPRASLLLQARQLRVIAVSLGRGLPGPIADGQIVAAARHWALTQKRRGRAQSGKWPIDHFMRVARLVPFYGVAQRGVARRDRGMLLSLRHWLCFCVLTKDYRPSAWLVTAGGRAVSWNGCRLRTGR